MASSVIRFLCSAIGARAICSLPRRFQWQAISITHLGVPDIIRSVLFVTTLGIAAMNVLVDGLMVEEGQRTGSLDSFRGNNGHGSISRPFCSCTRRLADRNLDTIGSGAVGCADCRLRSPRRVDQHAVLHWRSSRCRQHATLQYGAGTRRSRFPGACGSWLPSLLECDTQF